MNAQKKTGKQRIVYVLGAGASCASKNNFQGINNPLDNNFWQIASDLGELPKDSLLMRFLGLYYRNDFFKSNSNIKLPGMEDVYTFASSFTSILKLEDLGATDHLDKIDDSRRPIALLKHLDENDRWNKLVCDFIDEYSKTYDARNGSTSLKYFLFIEKIEQELYQLIYEVFKKINCNNNKGPWNCDLYNEFVKQVINNQAVGDIEATILSFNYDLLIDNAFSSMDKLINKDYSYYLWLHEFSNIDKILERTTGQTQDIIYLNIKNQFEIPMDKLELLKLHGSFNWYALYQDNMRDPKNVFFKDIRKVQEIIVNKQILVAFNEEGDRTRGYMVPRRVIIPPIIDKLGKFNGQVYFESLWRRSFEKLKDADKIVFIGYSMPVADYLSKWLFKTSLSNNPNVKIELCLHKPKNETDKASLNIIKSRYENNLERDINYNDEVDFEKYVESGLKL